jgi:hypothetical protein
MSILSAMWSRNKGAISSIVKPLVSHIPVVGDFAASRINMSPTPAQSELSTTTAVAVQNATQAIAPLVPQANATAPAPQLLAPSSMPGTPMFGVGNQGAGGMSQQTLMLLAGGALLLVVLMSQRK